MTANDRYRRAELTTIVVFISRAMMAIR